MLSPFNPEFLNTVINVGLENLNGPRVCLNDHSGQLDVDVWELGRGRNLFLPLLDFSSLNCETKNNNDGLVRDLNPGPLAP